MKLSKLLILLVITALVIVAAVSFWQNRVPEKSREKALLFPQLEPRLNEVRIVEIKGYEESVILSHQNGLWLVQSSDNFPALSEKVRTAIINLSELKINSYKTKNPELYSKLAVEGPYDRQSHSKQLSLLDENGEILASLIVGKTRQGNDAIPALYGRLPDAKQALLLQGKLDISSDDKDWFEQTVIDLSSDEVKRVTIQHPDEESFTLEREEEGQINFQLQVLPEGKKAQSEVILNSVGTLLETVRAESVRSSDLFNLPEQSIRVEVETFRGLIVHIRLAEQNQQYYANLHFSYQNGEQSPAKQEQETAGAEQEVQQLNLRMSAWVFEIPKYKYDDMTKKLDQFIRD